jgi:hypothetical protein
MVTGGLEVKCTALRFEGRFGQGQTRLRTICENRGLRPTGCLAISDSNFDMQSENSSL